MNCRCEVLPIPKSAIEQFNARAKCDHYRDTATDVLWVHVGRASLSVMLCEKCAEDAQK